MSSYSFNSFAFKRSITLMTFVDEIAGFEVNIVAARSVVTASSLDVEGSESIASTVAVKATSAN